MASPSRPLSLSSEAQPTTSSITVDRKFSDKTNKGVSLPLPLAMRWENLREKSLGVM